MEELKFAHIAPYLPFGLRMVDERIGKLTLTGAFGNMFPDSPNMGFSMNNFALYCRDEYNFKPILKNMEDFVDSADWGEMEKMFRPHGLRLYSETTTQGKVFGFIDDEDGRYGEEIPVSYNFYQELFRRHYDVFGLIEKGLAVDMKTIEHD